MGVPKFYSLGDSGMEWLCDEVASLAFPGPTLCNSNKEEVGEGAGFADKLISNGPDGVSGNEDDLSSQD